MRRIFVFLTMAIILSCFSNVLAQSGEIKFNHILVNDQEVKPENFGSIVVSNKDTLIFDYSFYSNSPEKSAFLFKIVLKNNNEENINNTNNKTVKYFGLPEGNYIFTVSVFDPRNSVSASPMQISFRVNNNEAKLLKEIAELKEKAKQKDTLKPEVKTGMKIGGIDIISALTGLLGSLVLCAAFLSIYVAKNSHNKAGKTMNSEPKGLSPEEVDKIIAENNMLKAEITGLRFQIDAMQSRSSDLQEQNKELKEKIDKLSASKQELEDLQRQKDDLCAVIIHDIKNPAALIKSLVELLRSYDLTATEQQEVIDDIVETTSRIVTLSQEVSRILALESSTLRMNFEENDVNEIINDVYRRNMVAANAKEIKVELDIEQNGLPIDCDAQRIDEVIENLISNAIKFSHKGGIVKIATKKADDDLVEIAVTDNGLGLSQDDIKNAFKKGVRLTARPTANESSSGFGLWVVKKLVEAHNGRVKISSSLGKGSTFTVILPIKQIIKPEDE
jgi:signal transduction histidine kinase